MPRVKGNRLAEVKRVVSETETTVAAYEYDGLFRRIEKTVSNSGEGIVPGSDDDGNLTDVYLPGDGDRDGDVYQADLAALLASWGKCEGEQGYNRSADFNGDGCVNESDMAILLARWGTTNKSLQIRYTWDAENRLVYVGPVFEPVNGDKKVEFTYDYRGRRVEKAVYAWNEEDPNDPNDSCWETPPPPFASASGELRSGLW